MTARNITSATLRVVDVFGRVIIVQNLEHEKADIDMRRAETGVYSIILAGKHNVIDITIIQKQ